MADKKKFEMGDASRIIAVINDRVEKAVKSGAKVEYTWGAVASVEADGRTAGAYLYGETEGAYISEGFRVPDASYVTVGEKVKVAMDYQTGERWITERHVSSAYKKLAFDLVSGKARFGDGVHDLYASIYATVDIFDNVSLNIDKLLTVDADVVVLGGDLFLGYDVKISRAGANVLATGADDDLQVGGDIFTLGGDIYLGAVSDVRMQRTAADTLTLYDTFIIASGNALYVGGSGAGQSTDGVNISGSGTIEMRSANPFIDFKVTDVDYGARIIYDFDIADGMEFNGAAEYRFDALLTTLGSLSVGGSLIISSRTLSGAAPIVRVLTSSGTWTKPTGLSHIVVECVGGGGGGGGTPATGVGQQSMAAGGGGGGYVRMLLTAADLASLTTAYCTVGGGGSGGTGGANGGTGTTSSFAQSTGTFSGSPITASGGAGGDTMPATSGSDNSNGGAGGVGSGGDINARGGSATGARVMTGVVSNYSTSGGSIWGGGKEPAKTGAGSTGYTYGGGGSGATATQSVAARNGGAGGAGIVIVTEYYL